jgi:hypothetical protein
MALTKGPASITDDDERMNVAHFYDGIEPLSKCVRISSQLLWITMLPPPISGVLLAFIVSSTLSLLS